MASALMHDYRQAELDAETRGLLDFSAKLTGEPWSFQESDVQRLRELGLEDDQILSVVLITCLYNFAARVAQGLGVEFPDQDLEAIEKWLVGPARDQEWLMAPALGLRGRCSKGATVTNSTIRPDGLEGQGVALLAVRPHPDDESSSTGGMLAYYSARGVRTGVVICTGGEEGEIRDPDLDPEVDKPRLGEIRAGEVKDACAILGVAELRMLGYRDSGMSGAPANQHPAAFMNAERVEAVGNLVRIIRELRPSVIVTEPSGGLYAHPDHVMCHDVSLGAFQAAGDAQAFPEAGPPWQVAKLYAVAQIDDGCWQALLPEFTAAGFDMTWLERRPQDSQNPGPETATVALDVRPYSEHQRRALLAHRTQIPRESFFVSLPPELRSLAFATSYFLRLAPPSVPGEHESDLLDGLDEKLGIR